MYAYLKCQTAISFEWHCSQCKTGTLLTAHRGHDGVLLVVKDVNDNCLQFELVVRVQ